MIVERGIPTEALIVQVLVAKYARFQPDIASNLTHPPLQSGSHGQQGIGCPCANTSSGDCDDQSGCVPMRRQCRNSILGGGEAGLASHRLMPEMPVLESAMMHRWSPLSKRQTKRGSEPRHILANLSAFCRSWLQRQCILFNLKNNLR